MHLLQSVGAVCGTSLCRIGQDQDPGKRLEQIVDNVGRKGGT
jgi:hypothetical protein